MNPKFEIHLFASLFAHLLALQYLFPSAMTIFPKVLLISTMLCVEMGKVRVMIFFTSLADAGVVKDDTSANPTQSPIKNFVFITIVFCVKVVVSVMLE